MLVTPAQLQGRLRESLTARLRIVKAEDRRYVLGLAYGPGQLDGHGEFMTPETVEQAAWGYLADGGRQVGIQHADGMTGVGQVVESYVWRAPDWTVTDATGGEQVIRQGDWLLGVVFDPQTWQLVKSGRVQGWSIDGAGRRRKVARSTAPITKATDRTGAALAAEIYRNLTLRGTA